MGRLSPKKVAWWRMVTGRLNRGRPDEAFLQSRSAIAGHLAMQGMVVWHGTQPMFANGVWQIR